MMITVTLNNFTLTEMLEIVADLRNQGYRQGQDFDFAYHPEKFTDQVPYDRIQERHIKFMFYDEQLGLFFKLKQGQ